MDKGQEEKLTLLVKTEGIQVPRAEVFEFHKANGQHFSKYLLD